MIRCPACCSSCLETILTCQHDDGSYGEALQCLECGEEFYRFIPMEETSEFPDIEADWTESNCEESWEESHDDFDCDDSDDGGALASAGFGTDEDYGHFYDE